VKTKFLFFINYPVCDILLKWHKWTDRDESYQYCIVHLKFTNKIDLMWSLHAEKNDLYEELNMLITGFNKKMYIKTSCCIILSITVNKTDR
jgi:hypothetical protein